MEIAVNQKPIRNLKRVTPCQPLEYILFEYSKLICNSFPHDLIWNN